MNLTVRKILLLLVWYGLMNAYECQNKTCVVILHGRGESRTDGLAYNFVKNVDQVIVSKSLQNNYFTLNVGLSDNSTEDNNWSSFKDMGFQSDKLCEYIKKDNIWQQLVNASRIVLVGCSQGALLLRGLLWGNCLDPFVGKIDKLITFGGPNSGIFGIPDCSQLNADEGVETLCMAALSAYNQLIDPSIGPAFFDSFMYTTRFTLSFGDYWNSPATLFRPPIFVPTYLRKINNQCFGCDKGKYLSQKLERGLVLISFGDENTVFPTNSASFGFWNAKGQNLKPYRETQLYSEDWIGLKTLDDKGFVTLYTIDNRTHMSIPYDFVDNKFFEFLI